MDSFMKWRPDFYLTRFDCDLSDSGKPIGGVSPQVDSTSSAIILSPQQFINLRPESELLAPTASAQFKSQQIVNFSTTQGKTNPNIRVGPAIQPRSLNSGGVRHLTSSRDSSVLLSLPTKLKAVGLMDKQKI